MDEATMVAMEVKAEGEDGVLIRRFGPAHLWGHWELDKLWVPEAMPLTVRLVLENGTDAIWSEVSVRLTCPEGWQAAGRMPRHWSRPKRMQDAARVVLNGLPMMSREVAPFWVSWPDDLALDLGWHEGDDVPFHATTQPGPGLTLYATNIDAPLEVTFDAEVTITTEEGETIKREIAIPVRVVPADRR
jgi:hypothetical protein